MPKRNINLSHFQDATVTVDRERGHIANVSVICGGTTKTSGNGMSPFDIDAIALQQVADAINASGIGVKSRITHPEIDGADDLPCRVGYIRNARVVGTSVRADMVFHDPESTQAKTLMSIAETDPSSCGLSIVSADANVEPSSTATGMVLRLSKLDACDWVGDPAANPTGMLSTHQPQNRKPIMLTAEQKKYLKELGLAEDADQAATDAFIAGLADEQKAELEAKKAAPAEGDTTALAADNEDEDGPADPQAAFVESLTPEQLALADKIPTEDQPTQLSAARGTRPLTQKDVQAALADERARVREIRGIALRCGYDDKWVDDHVDKGTSLNDVRRIALQSLNREPNSMPRTQVTVGADRNRESLNQAVQDAIMLRAGRSNFVQFDETGRVMLSADNRPETRQAHERANEFRGHSIIDMGRRYLIALGYHAADRMNRTQLATLLMSRTQLQSALSGGVYLAQATGDFPYILADSMGKVLRGEYALAPHTWSMWCRSTTAPDYKDIKALQLSEAADLEVIPEGDEYTYSKLTESRETYALSKYGKGLKFTREMLINDDLSAFDRVPRLMGRAAARKVESLAIAVLTANAALADSNALFSTAHSNLSTGALTVQSLGTARSKLRRQTALGSDDPLELTPKFLLVPETIATTADQLVSSTVDPSKSNATPNPFSNTLQVIPSARLDSDSTTQWYLLADPSEIDTVEVAFLEGEETPVVEEEDEFDSDVRKVKVRHNIAAKAIDYRGMVRSSGA